MRTRDARGSSEQPSWALLLLFCCCLPCLIASDLTASDAVVFLTRYGYLPASDSQTGNLRSESEFRKAIAAMQRFGGLPPTGSVDEATRALMRARRCGVADYLTAEDRVRRYAIQGQKWPSTNLTWSVKSEPSDGPRFRSQLRRAFQIWSEASSLSFLEIQGPADILVSFLKGPHGDGYPFDGEGSVLAHAFFPGEGIGGDAHFDAEERWLAAEPNSEDGVNLFAVAAHEIGHSLGLSHSSMPGSLMFPYYQSLDEHFRLPQDDAEGIRHLYGSKEPTAAPTTVNLETTTTTTTRMTTTKKSSSKPTKTPPKKGAAPDLCNSFIDAISLIRREIFVFKGKHFWRLHANRTLRSGYPVSIDRFWYDLPPDLSRIDALYERPQDTKIVFFTGRKYWLFSANQLEPGYPKPLSELGLPEDVDRIDAALVWGHNGKTYLFSGSRYWKYDEQEARVELDYPRNITAWGGVPRDIDAAFQWTDGNTYFFKNDKFWKFVDVKMKVEKKSPFEIAGFWFRCPSKKVEEERPGSSTTSRTHLQVNHSSRASSCYWLALLVLLLSCRRTLWANE